MSSLSHRDKSVRRREAADDRSQGTATTVASTPSPKPSALRRVDRILMEWKSEHSMMEHHEEGNERRRRPQHLATSPLPLQSHLRPSQRRRPMNCPQRSTTLRHDDCLLTSETPHVDYSRGIPSGRGSSPSPSVITATPSTARSVQGRSRSSPPSSSLYPRSPSYGEMLTPPTSNRKTLQDFQRGEAMRRRLGKHQIYHSGESSHEANHDSFSLLPLRKNDCDDGRRLELDAWLRHSPDDGHREDDDDDSLERRISLDQSISLNSQDMNNSLSTADWTLQSFADHQLQASYLDGKELVGARARDKRRVSKLTLTSAHSVSPMESPGNGEAEGEVRARQDKSKRPRTRRDGIPEEEESPNDGSLSTADWTLQTFADHQLQASYLDGKGLIGARVGGGGKSSRRISGLSLASAHSNSPMESPGNSESDSEPRVKANRERRTKSAAKMRGSKAKSPPSKSGSALRSAPFASLVTGELIPKRRRLLPKLLLVCMTVIAVSCAFFVNVSKDLPPVFSILRRDAEEESNAKVAQDWHPMFEHGHRTADVEVEVPVKTKPAKKSSAKREAVPIESIQIGGPPPNGAGQGFAHPDNGQGFTHRRLQEDDGSSEPTFLQGDVVQELCPAVHTLISQSLILRSSYGNIFAITTPEDPNGKKRKRNADDVHASSPHMGASHGTTSTVEVEGDEDEDGVFARNLQNADPLSIGSGTGGSYEETGNYNDIDTATESIYNGTGIETITIKTLSLRMSDFRPDVETHFEVWLYTGSGDEPDFELNENDLDDDPTNDNFPGMVPSKGEYQASRAKFADWQLVTEGLERELIPDRDFFDHNGHIFNIGTGTTIGPLGRLDGYENMEDVTLAAKKWNREKLREDGGMDAITAEGEVTTTYFYKIPEEKFTPLKLPKYGGKLTLFVTLDRVGLQYGYAAKREFDKVDVMKHDYVDQTPSLDVQNGNVNMRMHVGEGVIFYPWMEEEFFYQTRRFLGKIWYDAKIPCEYANLRDELGEGELTPSQAPSYRTGNPTAVPSMAPSYNGTNATFAMLISVLIKDETGEMPPDVMEVFEDTVLDFVDDSFGEFCPLIWNEQVTITDQEVNPIGGTPSGSTAEQRKRDSSGHVVSERRRDDYPGGGGRYLRRLQEVLEPIFAPPANRARERLLQAITVLDATATFEALYSTPQCPDKTPEEWASLIETFINDNKEELLDRLKDASDYFAEAFGVSADAVDAPTEIRSSEILTEEEDSNAKWAILAALLALLCCCCCCCLLPLLIVRRHKRKEAHENEIIGEDIEWARPVDEDAYPPLGMGRADDDDVSGVGLNMDREDAGLRKRPDGEFEEEIPTGPYIGLNPIPPGINPSEGDTDMTHSTKWFDPEFPENPKKRRPYGMPGRLPEEDEDGDPYGINIFPGGDYEDTEDGGDGIDLRHVERESENPEDWDWKPDHYEPDGGVHGYDRDAKSTTISSDWSRLAQKGQADKGPKKKLSIKELVLQRKKDLESKMAALRHVEKIEAGEDSDGSSQEFQEEDPDDRIEDLMDRIKSLETTRNSKYQRKPQQLGESDYEVWRRLHVGDDELSSSDESSDEEVVLSSARKKKRKKKKKGDDYMLRFDDLDAYNRALAVHQDAYIHKWVKVKVEKGEGEDVEEGANLDDIEMGPDGDQPPPDADEASGYYGGMDPPEEGVELDEEGRPLRGRPGFGRQATEHMGDVTLGDVSSLGGSLGNIPEGSEASGIPSGAAGLAGAAVVGRDRRTDLGRQQTEYIGDFDDLDDGNASAATGEGRDPNSRQSSVRSQGTGNEWSLVSDSETVEDDLSTPGGRLRAYMRAKSQGGDDSSVTSGRSARSAVSARSGRSRASMASSKRGGRRAALSKQKTEYIGSVMNMGDDDDASLASAASAKSAGRRAAMSKQKTEYIGSVMGMGGDDDDRSRSSAASAKSGNRRAAMSKQKTEYIGSVMGMGDDDDDRSRASAASAKSGGRRAALSKQNTEYIGSVMGMDGGGDEEGGEEDLSTAGGRLRAAMKRRSNPRHGDDSSSISSGSLFSAGASIASEEMSSASAGGTAPRRKSALRSKGDRRISRSAGVMFGSIREMDNEDDDEGPLSTAATPTDRRAGLSREKTEYIGSIRGMDEAGDGATAAQAGGDRRSAMSRQQTEYIGSIRDMDQEGDGAAAARAGGDRRSMMGRQQTEYIGSIRGMDDVDGDALPAAAGGDRRSAMSRQQTEYIGSVRGMESDDGDGTAGGDRRAMMGRQQTEYISSVRGIGGDDEQQPSVNRRAGLSREKTEYIGSVARIDEEDEEDMSTPGSRRAMMNRQQTEYIGSIRGIDGDGDDNQQQSVNRRAGFSREKTEYIGSVARIEEEDDQEDVSAPGSRRAMMGRQQTEYIGSARGMDGDDDQHPPVNRRAGFSREKTEYIGSVARIDEGGDEEDDRRAMMGRQQTEYIGSIRGMDDDDEQQPSVNRRAGFSREKTEYIGSVARIEEEEEDEEDLSTPGARMRAMMRKKG